MITIFHNQHCSKSREALAFLSENNIDFKLVNILKEPLTVEEIKDILAKLKLSVHDIIRKNEKIYKEEFADQNLSEDELITMLIEHPKLMQRPILVKDHSAVIGRPFEVVENFVKN